MEAKENFCELCKKQLKNKYSYRFHMRTIHENPQLFHCEICNKTIKGKYSFKSHVKLVHEKQFYQCEECGKKFLSAAGLINHIEQVHEKIENNKERFCKIYEEKFDSESKLKEHVLVVHEEENEYVCAFCTSTFTNRAALMRHFESKHDSTRFHCDLCSKSFSCRNYLKTHMLRRHGVKTSETKLKTNSIRCKVCYVTMNHEEKKNGLQCERCKNDLHLKNWLVLLEHRTVIHED